MSKRVAGRGKQARDEDDTREKQRRTMSPAEAQRQAQRDGAVPTSFAYEKEQRLDVDEDVSDWEDVDSNSDVDERFEDMEEEEVVDSADEQDEDDDEAAEQDDEEDAALADKLDEKMKHVSFEDEDDEGAGDDEARVWRRDREGLDANMELEYSNKAYDSFFQLRTEYPALSFDVIEDQEGANRTKYPLSMYLICGSQADEQNKNQLYVMKISNICKTRHDAGSDDEDEDELIGESDGSEGDDDEGEERNNGEPIVEHRAISHFGTANRVRCAKGDPNLVAVWSDAGHVQVFNINSEYQAMANFANWSKEQARAWDRKKVQSLVFCSPSSTHKTEGYALDWSGNAKGVFASGDCNGQIFVWQPAESRWTASASTGTGRSVEEIRWSPTQPNYFISARAGGTVEVWDTRDMRRPQAAWQADATDINVADWNAATQSSHLLVTGADSGMVAVWDLRQASKGPDMAPVQRLQWHTGSITSVQFSPHNETVLAATGSDGQCTIWDISLERDPDEEKQVIGELFEREDLSGLPDQLMFQHQGLVHPKEVHFHAQIPGMTITTDYNGLHLFKPMNWRSLMK